jgi:hypothetical protein
MADDPTLELPEATYGALRQVLDDRTEVTH